MNLRHWVVVPAAAVVLSVMCITEHPVAQAPPAQAGDSRAESIGIHGNWVIDVRNPDGSLARHLAFRNALQPDGATAMVNVLSGAQAFGPISVLLSGSPSPCSGGRGSTPCIITPTSAAQSQPVGALVLTGTTTASIDGTINLVQTLTQTVCNSNGMTACGSPNGQLVFTAFSFASGGIAPIPVTAGQVIQVTVTLSFS